MQKLKKLSKIGIIGCKWAISSVKATRKGQVCSLLMGLKTTDREIGLRIMGCGFVLSFEFHSGGKWIRREKKLPKLEN